MEMKLSEQFEALYHAEPEGVAFCPYRVCPVGAHVDHQLGKVTGFALDKGIRIAYRPKHNGVIELRSRNFSKRAQFHVREVPEEKENDWADYLRGATLLLGRRHPLQVGLAGVIEGSLPIGGLSSSAAVILSFLEALCRVNQLHLSPAEYIEIAQAAENQYVGVACGKLDQSCEVLCQEGRLLYLDTRDGQYELVPPGAGMAPFRLAILFSGLERTLIGTKYNMRVDECRAAAYALKGYAGMEYGKFAETCLREVPPEVFAQYGDRLPKPWRQRAEHWYREEERVEQAVAAWRRGDLREFGRISFASGRSTIDNWETGCPEMKRLYEIMAETDGVLGGRFSGAGFKGCCLAIIEPDAADAVEERVTREYLAAFPELTGRFSVHICDTASGIAHPGAGEATA